MEENLTEETKSEYRNFKKAANKAFARAMKEESVRKINELGRNPNNIFRLVKKINMHSTDVFGGRCMRENDGALYLNEKERITFWKGHMPKYMNEVTE